jgi:hypothetical protein
VPVRDRVATLTDVVRAFDLAVLVVPLGVRGYHALRG